MIRRARTTLLWLGIAAIVVLLSRTIAYAVEPGAAARVLQREAGGPALPVLVLVSLALGASIAVAICRLAALGVRERALLEPRTLAEPVQRLRVIRMLVLAVALAVTTSITGGLLEAYLHWRAGLGWHGLQCLVGPVHHNLIPIETALSLVAVAIVGAAEHVSSWMRRTFALVRRLPPCVSAALRVLAPATLELPPRVLCLSCGSSRGPPAFS